MLQHVAVGAEFCIDLLAKVGEGVRGCKPHVLHKRRGRGRHRAKARGFRHPGAQQAEHQDDGVGAVVALWRREDLEARLRAKQPMPRERQHAAELRGNALREPTASVAVSHVHDQAGACVQRAGGVRRAEPQEQPVRRLAVTVRVDADRQQELTGVPHAGLLFVTELDPAAHEASDVFGRDGPSDVRTEAVRADVERQLQYTANLRQGAQEELQDAFVHASPGAQHRLSRDVDAPAFT